MKTKQKMILGLAGLLGVSAAATAVSGYAWFTTTTTGSASFTTVSVYTLNSSLTVSHVASNTASTPSYTGSGTENIVYDCSGITDNLTDISSNDGIHMYSPKWTSTNPGVTAEKINEVSAGDLNATVSSISGYISVTLKLAVSGRSDMDIYISAATIAAASEGTAADEAAAGVTRMAFIETTKSGGIYTLSNNIMTVGKNITPDSTGKSPAGTTGYDKGISKEKVDNAGSGPYTVTELLDSVKNPRKSPTPSYAESSNTDSLYKLCTLSNSGTAYITCVIWLEGSSKVDTNGKYNDPIGGTMNISFGLVAFLAYQSTSSLMETAYSNR